MRTLVIVGLLAVPACDWVLGFHALKPDARASGDAHDAPIDAKADAALGAVFCPVHPSARFCADFDDTFTGINLFTTSVTSGGSYVYEASPLSPPNALVTRLPVQGTSAQTTLTTAAGFTSFVGVIDFVVSSSTASDAAACNPIVAKLSWPPSDIELVLQAREDGFDARLVGTGCVLGPADRFAVPSASDWNPVRLMVNVGQGTVAIVFESGASQLSCTALENTTYPMKLTLGVVSPTAHPDCDARFDNVLIP